MMFPYAYSSHVLVENKFWDRDYRYVVRRKAWDRDYRYRMSVFEYFAKCIYKPFGSCQSSPPKFGSNEWAVNELVKVGANINRQDQLGKTPLVMFLQKGNFDVSMIRTLLENGADPNLRDNANWTALHYCIQYQAAATIIQLLLDYGANVNARDSNQKTPLQLLLRFVYCYESVKVLLKNGATVYHTSNGFHENLIHEVCTSKQQKLLEVLIESGVEVESPDLFRRTVLINAVRVCYPVSVISSLLKRANNVNAKDNASKTALHYTSMYKDDEGPKVAICLLEHGADVNARDNFGDTPLMDLVRYNRDWRTVRVVLQSGADPNALNFQRQSALYITCLIRGIVGSTLTMDEMIGWENSKTIVANLINYGADVFINVRWTGNPKMNRMPLHLVREPIFGRDSIISMLLRKMIFLNDGKIQDEQYFKDFLNLNVNIKDQLEDHVSKVISEVEAMKRFIVKGNRNLKSYCAITDEQKLGLCFINSSLIDLQRKDIQPLFPLYYPHLIRKKILIGKIWENILRKIDLLCLSVTVKDEFNSREVILNTACIRKISTFLDRNDLRQVFIAAGFPGLRRG